MFPCPSAQDLAGDLVNFILCVAVFFAAGYAIAYFMIGRFHFATPGRLGNYNDDSVSRGTARARAGFPSSGDSQAGRIISLLGGRDNIVLVDACMTRLRVTVKDVDKVAGLPERKAEGAMGLIKRTAASRQSTDRKQMCLNPISMIYCHRAPLSTRSTSLLLQNHRETDNRK